MSFGAYEVAIRDAFFMLLKSASSIVSAGCSQLSRFTLLQATNYAIDFVSIYFSNAL